MSGLWRSNAERLCSLKHIALKYLWTPAEIAPLERPISIIVLTGIKRRSRLSCRHLEILLIFFCNKRIDLIVFGCCCETNLLSYRHCCKAGSQKIWIEVLCFTRDLFIQK